MHAGCQLYQSLRGWSRKLQIIAALLQKDFNHYSFHLQPLRGSKLWCGIIHPQVASQPTVTNLQPHSGLVLNVTNIMLLCSEQHFSLHSSLFTIQYSILLPHHYQHPLILLECDFGCGEEGGYPLF